MNNTCIALVGRLEDDEYWYQTLSKNLAGYGVIKTIEEDDLEALKQLSCQIKLVIIDAGSVTKILDRVSWIRKEFPQNKILVVTASPLWKEVRQVIYAGADDYCQKSLDMEGILEHIERLIGRHRKSEDPS
jgi:DNA-binding response OmpR family regulator